MAFGNCTVVKVSEPTTLADIGKKAYETSGDGRLEAFRAMNQSAERGGFVAQGSRVLLPLSPDLSSSQMTGAQAMSVRINSKPSGANRDEINLVNSSFDLMDFLSRSKDSIELFTDPFENAHAYLNARVALIKHDIETINKVANKSLREGVSLQSPAFRKMVESTNDHLKKQVSQFGSAARKASNVGSGSIHALGVSYKGASKRLTPSGAEIRLNGIDKSLKKVDSLATEAISTKAFRGIPLGKIAAPVMKFLGPIGDLNEVYKAGRSGGATSAGKEAGKQAAGMAGEFLGTAGTTAIAVMMFGTATGGIGLAAIGIAAVLVGQATEYGAEQAFDFSADSVSKWLAKDDPSLAKPDSPTTP